GTLPAHIKVESDSMTHGLMLENAILEMETIVADCKIKWSLFSLCSKRVHGDIQDVDHPVATKSRLPCEVKQKLEIVARLEHSSQGRISDEIILGLTSILGHWLKPRALKELQQNMV
nr:ubinuclein-2-like isoform X3 [Tanacetum cinerariifolium]